MSDEETVSRDSDPDVDGGSDEPRDSMEDVLAEALAEEEDGGTPSLEGDVPSVDEVDIRDALRAALKPPRERIEITREVQKKLREDPELEGRYFVDGWSTATSPKETYLVTSLVMLVVVVVVYLLIGPYGL